MLDVLVICPVYNHEKYIRSCLDGIVKQEVNFVFKAYVHDDCSTDRSAAIIAEYAEKYPDIIVPLFEEENQHSKGDNARIIEYPESKYIAECEGDDYWCDCHKLQKQYDYMEAHPECSMVLHNTRIESVSDGSRDELFFHKNEVFRMSEEDIFDKWLVHTSSFFFRNNFERVPKWAKWYYSSDYTMLAVAYAHGPLDVLPDVMSVYRCENPHGATEKNLKSDLMVMIEKTRGRERFLKQYLDHYSVDSGAENVIRNRIAAINESTALQELTIRIQECSLSNSSDEEKISWLIQRLNDPLIRKACLDPSAGTENIVAGLYFKNLAKTVELFITSLNSSTKKSIHFTLLTWFARYYGTEEKEKDFLLAISASPENTVGWGVMITGNAEERKQKALLVANACQSEEDFERLNEFKLKIVEASQRNNIESFKENLENAMELNSLDRDLLYYKAYMNYALGDVAAALDEIGIYNLFYGMDDDVKQLYLDLCSEME